MGRIADRIARYRANTGTGGMLLNIGVLAYLGFVVSRLVSPFAQAMLAGIALVALALGWVIVPIGRVNIGFASRLISVLNWTVIGAVVVNFTGIYPLPPLLWLAVMGVLVWVISASFWLASEPHVTTGYAVEKMQREHRREAIRRGEI